MGCRQCRTSEEPHPHPPVSAIAESHSSNAAPNQPLPSSTYQEVHVEPPIRSLRSSPPPAKHEDLDVGRGTLEEPLLSAVPLRIPKPGNRAQQYLAALAESGDLIDPRLGNCLRQFKPVASLLIQFLWFAVQLYLWLYGIAYEIYRVAPKSILQMCFGLALCFFGGDFCASLAALEAFRTMGGEQLWTSLETVRKQANQVAEANRIENLADATELSGKELARRKIWLAMTTVKEPQDLQVAFMFLWTAWIAVLATLRVQFARTTALALGIAEMIEFPLQRAFGPPLAWSLGEDLRHWTDTIIGTTVKIVAVIFAWYIQMVISAFYSGLRGSHFLATGMMSLLHEHDCIADATTTHWHEIVMYPLATFGFYWQITSGFMVPFPFNIFLLPLSVLEWLLRYETSFGH